MNDTLNYAWTYFAAPMITVHASYSFLRARGGKIIFEPNPVLSFKQGYQAWHKFYLFITTVHIRYIAVILIFL